MAVPLAYGYDKVYKSDTYGSGDGGNVTVTDFYDGSQVTSIHHHDGSQERFSIDQDGNLTVQSFPPLSNDDSDDNGGGGNNNSAPPAVPQVDLEFPDLIPIDISFVSIDGGDPVSQRNLIAGEYTPRITMENIGCLATGYIPEFSRRDLLSFLDAHHRSEQQDLQRTYYAEQQSITRELQRGEITRPEFREKKDALDAQYQEDLSALRTKQAEQKARMLDDLERGETSSDSLEDFLQSRAYTPSFWQTIFSFFATTVHAGGKKGGRVSYPPCANIRNLFKNVGDLGRNGSFPIAFEIDFDSDGTWDYYDTAKNVGPLASGEVTTASFAPVDIPPGNHRVRAILDPLEGAASCLGDWGCIHEGDNRNDTYEDNALEESITAHGTGLFPFLDNLFVDTDAEVTSIPFDTHNNTASSAADIAYELTVDGNIYGTGSIANIDPYDNTITNVAGYFVAPPYMSTVPMRVCIDNSTLSSPECDSAYIIVLGDPRVTQCTDGIDNDGDGLIDRDDPGCWDGDTIDTYNPNRDNEDEPTIDAYPKLVRAGEDVTVTWSPGGHTCTLSNNLSSLGHSAGGPTFEAQVPVTNTTIFSIDCGADEAKVMVRVLPTIEEN